MGGEQLAVAGIDQGPGASLRLGLWRRRPGGAGADPRQGAQRDRERGQARSRCDRPLFGRQRLAAVGDQIDAEPTWISCGSRFGLSSISSSIGMQVRSATMLRSSPGSITK